MREIGGVTFEKDISAEKKEAEKGTRLYEKNEDQRRKENPEEKKVKGKEKTFSLRAALSVVFLFNAGYGGLHEKDRIPPDELHVQEVVFKGKSDSRKLHSTVYPWKWEENKQAWNHGQQESRKKRQEKPDAPSHKGELQGPEEKSK